MKEPIAIQLAAVGFGLCPSKAVDLLPVKFAPDLADGAVRIAVAGGELAMHHRR